MTLHSLTIATGSRHLPKRVGHGIGSGMGKTSTRGQKGQGARQGRKVPVGFEGGQLPLYRRLPKHGFTNYGRVDYQVLNLRDLEARFEDGAEVDCIALMSSGLIKNLNNPVKVLGAGELTKKLSVSVQAYSASAKAAIEAKGGKADVVALKDARKALKSLRCDHCDCQHCDHEDK